MATCPPFLSTLPATLVEQGLSVENLTDTVGEELQNAFGAWRENQSAHNKEHSLVVGTLTWPRGHQLLVRIR